MAEVNGATKTPATRQTTDPISLVKRDVVDVVAAKVNQFIQRGELNMPQGYSVNNAIKSAWLTLQQVADKDGKPALAVCTRDSIANSLLDMVVQGLNVGKKQGYFIVYGRALSFQRSYFGSMAVAQMVNQRIGDFAYAVVYEGDTFKYGIKNGRKTITEHEQELSNVDKKKILAAYCIIMDKDDNPIKTEIMTIDEIKQAWRQSKMNPFDEKGNLKDSSTHGKFTAEMALKTVINRCCKAVINSSSDNALLLERINRNEDLADRAEAEAEIEEVENTGEVLEFPAQTQGVMPDPASIPDKTGEETAGPAAEQKRMPGF